MPQARRTLVPFLAGSVLFLGGCNPMQLLGSLMGGASMPTAPGSGSIATPGVAPGSSAPGSGSPLGSLVPASAVQGPQVAQVQPGLTDRLPRGSDGSTTGPGTAGGEVVKQGKASWYGPGFHGRKTANGETYDQNAMTAAMTEVPLGIWVRVVRTDTGAEVTVRVNDRGPYAVDGRGKAIFPLRPHPERVIDLSKAAMEALGGTGAGIIPVTVYRANAPGAGPT